MNRLQSILERHAGVPELSQALRHLLLLGSSVELYEQVLPQLERVVWRNGASDSDMVELQALYRELEQHYQQQGEDPRPAFLVVVPVADRPRHLADCLNSLLMLCRLYQYGGQQQGRFTKVSVLLADDSKASRSLQLHRRLASRFSQAGLQCHYFGPDEQMALLARIPEEEREQLVGVLGQQRVESFFHKGASITRNLAYLQIRRMLYRAPETLIHFIDSDQEFRTGLPGREPFAISYFHQLERIFRHTEALVVTGKVVGDPPVSPAVMAGNLLADVQDLLRQMAALDPAAACSFHQGDVMEVPEAAYHDMADLFGFRPADEALRYVCPLQGAHDHRACLSDFVQRLSRFFDGDHPTRKSHYHYSDPLSTLQPARTVYTGNYVLRSVALRYFIPFAPLKLRMAGPVLGRILQAELGRRFVSANLPLLHKRTQGDSGRSEFRPGVERQAQQVDLRGEFERQYYGDVMLFSMERLTAAGYPFRDCPADWGRQILVEVEAELSERYQQRRLLLGEGLQALQGWLQQTSPWWEKQPDLTAVRTGLDQFIANLRHNFLEQPMARDHARLSQLLEVILRYPVERQLWESLLARGVSAP